MRYFLCACVCVHICFSKLEKDTPVHKCFGLSPPFSCSESLTTSHLNHPLISSATFYISKESEQTNITVYTTLACCQPHSVGHVTQLAVAVQNSNFMNKLWSYLSWYCVYFDFKHTLIGFCVWGTSEVINYHGLSALVKATAAFHRGLAG